MTDVPITTPPSSTYDSSLRDSTSFFHETPTNFTKSSSSSSFFPSFVAVSSWSTTNRFSVSPGLADKNDFNENGKNNIKVENTDLGKFQAEELERFSEKTSCSKMRTNETGLRHSSCGDEHALKLNNISSPNVNSSLYETSMYCIDGNLLVPMFCSPGSDEHHGASEASSEKFVTHLSSVDTKEYILSHPENSEFLLQFQQHQQQQQQQQQEFLQRHWSTGTDPHPVLVTGSNLNYENFHKDYPTIAYQSGGSLQLLQQHPHHQQPHQQEVTTNPQKKKRRRIITTDQRRAANIRERRRMSHLNEAFDGLRKRVPTFAYEKKLSRIETLKLAVTYIKFMANLLETLNAPEDKNSNFHDDQKLFQPPSFLSPTHLVHSTSHHHNHLSHYSPLNDKNIMINGNGGSSLATDDDDDDDDDDSMDADVVNGVITPANRNQCIEIPLELTNYRHSDLKS